MHDPGGATRSFNTAGPMRPHKHYCIPPLRRMNQRELLALIGDDCYFVLHAPRQTGKTSALLALRDLLNGGAEGAYRCVYETRLRADIVGVETCLRANAIGVENRQRADVVDVETRLRAEVAGVETRLRAKVADARKEANANATRIENRLDNRLGHIENLRRWTPPPHRSEGDPGDAADEPRSGTG